MYAGNLGRPVSPALVTDKTQKCMRETQMELYSISDHSFTAMLVLLQLLTLPLASAPLLVFKILKAKRGGAGARGRVKN